MFIENQIVLNFKRNKIFRWNKKEHSKQFFSCRLATEFEEMLYNLFDDDIVEFWQIEQLESSKKIYLYSLKGNNKSKWTKRDKVTVPFEFDKWQIFHLQKLKYELKLNSFSEVLNRLIEGYDNKTLEEIELRLKDKTAIIEKFNEISKQIDNLKKQL